MSLGLWTVLCMAASLALRQRLFLLAVAALLIWCTFPGIAVPRINNYESFLSDVHPATVLVLTTLVVQVVSGSAELRAAAQQNGRWLGVAVAVAGVASITGLLTRGLTATAAIVNELIAPLSLFFLLGGCLLAEPRRADRLRQLIIAVATAEAVLAGVQATLQRPLVWARYYERQFWFDPIYGRWMGTFDHPLVLSLFLACALFLLAGVRRWWICLPVALVLVGGILVTQSRVGVLVAGVAWIYLLFRAPFQSGGRFLWFACGAVAAGFAYRAGLAAPLQERIANDGGSAEARQSALNYFGDHWGDVLWSGQGLGSSFRLASEIGLQTSFESAFLMYSLDLGIITTLAYMLLMVSIVATASRRRALPGSAAAAAAAVVMIQTFSALSGATTVPGILWALLALAAFTTTTAPGDVDPSQPRIRSSAGLAAAA